MWESAKWGRNWQMTFVGGDSPDTYIGVGFFVLPQPPLSASTLTSPQMEERNLGGENEKEIDMQAEQIILIGLIASAITFGLKVAATYANYKPGRVVVNIVLYVVSVVLAVQWSGAMLPTFPPFDTNIGVFIMALWNYLNAWIAVGAPILGSASLIYNLFYEKVVVPAFQFLAKK